VDLAKDPRRIGSLYGIFGKIHYGKTKVAAEYQCFANSTQSRGYDDSDDPEATRQEVSDIVTDRGFRQNVNLTTNGVRLALPVQKKNGVPLALPVQERPGATGSASAKTSDSSPKGNDIMFRLPIRRIVAASLLFAVLQANSLCAQQKVLLDWRMPEDSKRVSTFETVMSQVMDANGLQVKTSVEQKLTSSAQAGKKANDGKLPIRHKVEALQATMRLPFDMQLNFDSQKEFKKTGTAVDPLLDALNAFSDASWTTVLYSNLKAVDVVGNEKLLESYSPEIQQGLKSQLSNEELLRRHNQLIDSLPSTPVAVGETWTRKQYANFDLGQMMEFEKEYRYEGVVKVDGRPFDRISLRVKKVTVQLDDNPLGMKLVESNLKVDKSSGDVYFDRRRGWIYKSNEETKISGEMDFEIRDKITNAKIQLAITNRMTVR